MQLAELARKLGCELRGKGDVEITGVGPIEGAEPGQISFVANPRYSRFLQTTRASAVILSIEAPEVGIPSLRARDPYAVFAQVVEHFYTPPAVDPGIHPTAVIADSAVIGPHATIGPYVVIGPGARIGEQARIDAHVILYPDVTIGNQFVAYAHVVVRERVRIGNRVILHSGAVIGSDGFGYAAGPDRRARKIVQAGDVVLEDDVEVGANATIDRAAVGSTVIRRGAKIDNLVMIAHGCEIGEGSMLAAQVGVSGSTKLGRFVRMGGQSGAAGHLTIGNGAQVAAQSGVPNDVPPGATVGGYPAVEISLWRRVSAGVLRVPELLRRVRRIEKMIAARRTEEP